MPFEQFRFEQDDEPQEGDYVMSDDPHSRGTNLGVKDGRFIGVFEDRDAAEAEIKRIMKYTHFYPSVWWISDHGNSHRVAMKVPGRRRR